MIFLKDYAIVLTKQDFNDNWNSCFNTLDNRYLFSVTGQWIRNKDRNSLFFPLLLKENNSVDRDSYREYHIIKNKDPILSALNDKIQWLQNLHDKIKEGDIQ